MDSGGHVICLSVSRTGPSLAIFRPLPTESGSLESFAMKITQNIPVALVVSSGRFANSSEITLVKSRANILVMDDAARQRALIKRARIMRFSPYQPPSAA